MAKCEVCKCDHNKSPLFRINELGVTGIFRCRECLSTSTQVDETVKDIVNILQPPQ